MPGCEPRYDDGPAGEIQEVAGYRLLRRVGEGGMSTVYLSYDVAQGQSVAVKVLSEHLATSREFVSRFYREARLSRLLSHPNLVRGLAAGYDAKAGRHYLVLEFIEGPTTHAALGTHGRLPVGVVVKVGIDIARALEFLHSRQYVHRDVKPDNVLLHPDGVAKLADLGLAKRLNDDPQLTSVAQGVGTSYYMAYEQALNSTLVDGRSDIFALGATLYHLLTGEVPFPGATHEEVSRGKEHGTFCPAEKLNPLVPAELAGIIAQTLARDPRGRYQSAGELASALEATGLATRIPALASGEALEAPADAPTRADLRMPGQTEAPGATTVAIDAGSTGAPVVVSRSQWGLIGALAITTGVAGLLLANLFAPPSAPPTPRWLPTPPGVSQDGTEPTPPRSGPPRPAPR